MCDAKMRGNVIGRKKYRLNMFEWNKISFYDKLFPLDFHNFEIIEIQTSDCIGNCTKKHLINKTILDSSCIIGFRQQKKKLLFKYFEFIIKHANDKNKFSKLATFGIYYLQEYLIVLSMFGSIVNSNSFLNFFLRKKNFLQLNFLEGETSIKQWTE